MATLTVDQLVRGLQRLEKQLPKLVANIASLAKTRLSASATTDFMRNTAATRGGSLPRNELTGSGSLRIHTGRLARSLTGTSENISELTIRGTLISYLFGSLVPYASVHEDGFSGTVAVREHTRTITQAFGRDIAPNQATVKAHSKNMNIPSRPYLNPALDKQSDFLTNEINRRIYNAILAI
jgi:phage gpG-like protein